MCGCIGKIDKYQNLKPKLDSCYDKEINEAAIHATNEEVKIIGSISEFNKVKQSLGTLIKTNCEAVRNLIEKEVQPTSSNPYPTNFSSEEYKKAKKNLKNWNGKIVAFDGEVLEVQYPFPNKPYLKVKMGNETLWVGSMVNSQYDKVGAAIRFLGYFSLTSEDDFSKSYHKLGCHILAFGEIDHNSKQLAMLPGSEIQIKEWGQGQIPRGKN